MAPNAARIEMRHEYASEMTSTLTQIPFAGGILEYLAPFGQINAKVLFKRHSRILARDAGPWSLELSCVERT
jgi:hypothetical protein